jgi:hypothetical protein
VFYSTQPKNWIEIPFDGLGNTGITIAPTGDSTAIVAWSSLDEGLKVREVSGGQQSTKTDYLDGGVPYLPVFRPRPSGGLWLGWAPNYPFVRIIDWQNGIWGSLREIPCAYRDSLHKDFYASVSMELSRDTNEYPVVAWTAQSSYTGLETICACTPTTSGWGSADDLQGTDSGVLPSVVRDRNGDVWIAFFKYVQTGIFWLHTYTHAIASTPQVVVHGNGLATVSWNLSESAPESWWAVLKEDGAGNFIPTARLQAGSGLTMSWTDSSATSGTLRYEVRRESVDIRYQWTSNPSDAPVPALPTITNVETGPGRVRLVWFAGKHPDYVAVQRRTRTSDWSLLGLPTAEDNGFIAFEDAGLDAGDYAYRLALSSDNSILTSETWVSVPAGFALSLAGFQPNPAASSASIAFSLASGAPARLEVFDVTGRRVLGKEVGFLGPGDHFLTLERNTNTPMGVYWIRLSQSGRTLTAKGILTK